MIKTVQSEVYHKEIQSLRQQPLKNISPKSSIYHLDPFLDDNGVFRIGGRSRHADEMFEEKHPAILPRGAHLAKLAIIHCHSLLHHQGQQMTYGAMKQACLWIAGAKRLIAEIINQCVTCRKLRGKTMTQHMADLPGDRLDTPPPFTNDGFFVFGPWQICTRRTRGRIINSKTWASFSHALIVSNSHWNPGVDGYKFLYLCVETLHGHSRTAITSQM